MSRRRALWPGQRVADLKAENERLSADLAAVNGLLTVAKEEVRQARQAAKESACEEIRVRRLLHDAERKLAEQPPAHDCGTDLDRLRRNLAAAEQTINQLRRDREALWARLDADAGLIDPDLVVAS